MALLRSLTDDDLKELVPLLGERKRIKTALAKNILTKETPADESLKNMVSILYVCILCRKHVL